MVNSRLYITKRVLCIALVMKVVSAGTSRSVESGQRGEVSSTGAAQIRLSEAYGKLPLTFEENRGQTGGQVKFLARGKGYNLFLTPREALLSLRQRVPQKAALIKMRWVGGNDTPETEALSPLPVISNYFLGNDPTKWRKAVPHYGRIRYREVYPGVDLVFHGNQRRLEYDFVVSPGADPGRIRLAFDGVKSVRIDRKGDLILSTVAGELRQHKPVIFQESDGIRKEIAGGYVVKGKHQVTFAVAGYNRREPLIIDPVLTYSTFFGGSSTEETFGIALDSAGNAYVTGFTQSASLDNVPPGVRPTLSGAPDAFVTKLNPTGTAALYFTYLGGGSTESADGIAVDSLGNAYVTGQTFSADFPVAGAYQSSLRGNSDIYVTKLNTSGAIAYSTYFGGNNNEGSGGIAVDSAGGAYVTGLTTSSDFPILGAFQTSLGGFQDAFVAKLNPNVSGSASLVYSTFLGGSDVERGNGIAVDRAGNVYAAGTTSSGNFPVVSAYQSTKGGGSTDAFATKINPAFTGSSSLLYSTYLGGTGDELGNGIATDSAGMAYIVGSTQSVNFPVSPGAFQPALDAGQDAFVTKLNPLVSGAQSLVYSTFLGGAGRDVAVGVAVNMAGNAYVTGWTESDTFPTAVPIQPNRVRSLDVFVTKLNVTGTALVYSTYLGGTAAEIGRSIALNLSGDAYVTGETLSSNFPVTPGSLKTYLSGTEDAFILRISETDKAGVFRSGLWVIDANGNGAWDGPFIDAAFLLGQSGDVAVIGDWNGSGSAKAGVFRNGLWVLDYNGNKTWDGLAIDRAFLLGQQGDVPVVGDWNGDGRAKAGVFRNGLWVLDYNGNGVWDGIVIDRAFLLGQQGDVPVVGDWNGDGRAKAGVFRSGLWVLDYNGNGVWEGPGIDRAFYLGQAGDKPVIGDWNGSGTIKAGIFRAGLWVLDYNGNFTWDGLAADRAFLLGQADDQPVIGDWNGSGTSKAGVFRSGLWVLDHNGNFAWDGPAIDRAIGLGQAGDTPVPARW